MEVQGRVENGVVVIVGGMLLPEGADVNVVYPIPGRARSTAEKRRIQLPLVHCHEPGGVHLTNERIEEILSAEDAAPRH
jgi:hypothetical protein